LLLLESASGQVLRVDRGGFITIAVTRGEILAATGESSISFRHKGLAIDDSQALYFTEVVSGAVLKKSADGTVTVLASRTAIEQATGERADPDGLVFGADGYLYLTDDAFNSQSILRVDPETGAVTVYASGADLEALPEITSIDIETGIAAGDDGTIYALSDGDPNAVIEIAPDGTPSVLTFGPPFADLDVFMTRAANGHLIIADDVTDSVFRITTEGLLAVEFTEEQLEDVSGEIDLQGGIAYDEDGYLFLVDNVTDSVLRFDSTGNGQVWLAASDIAAATGVDPDLHGGIAFAFRSEIEVLACGLTIDSKDKGRVRRIRDKVREDPSSAFVEINCGYVLGSCSSTPPDVHAELIAFHVNANEGQCDFREESFAVECGETIKIKMRRLPCSTDEKQTERPTTSTTAGGRRIFSAHGFELRITATDSCDNESEACTENASTLLMTPRPNRCDGQICGLDQALDFVSAPLTNTTTTNASF